MINVTTDTLKDAIIGLGICERFGGLAMPFEMNDGDKIVRVPVTVGVDGQECYELGTLFDLAPNSLYKSVMFFEDSGGSKITRERKDVLSFSYSLRLLAWLNFIKLGQEDAGSYTDRAAALVVKTLFSGDRTFPVTDPDITSGIVIVDAVSIPRKDRSVFSRYTFAQWQKAFVFPYDFFALDIEARLLVGIDCFTEVAPADPLDCVEGYDPWVSPGGDAWITPP